MTAAGLEDMWSVIDRGASFEGLKNVLGRLAVILTKSGGE